MIHEKQSVRRMAISDLRSYSSVNFALRRAIRDPVQLCRNHCRITLLLRRQMRLPGAIGVTGLHRFPFFRGQRIGHSASGSPLSLQGS
jgi:hypothetical protein